jgi:hypothetical protein
MQCCIVILALGAPRVALFLVWLFSDYIGPAYDGLVLPVLGFVFAPLTTLAYAWSWHTYGGMEDLGTLVVVLALLMDLGVIGGASRKRG